MQPSILMYLGYLLDRRVVEASPRIRRAFGRRWHVCTFAITPLIQTHGCATLISPLQVVTIREHIERVIDDHSIDVSILGSAELTNAVKVRFEGTCRRWREMAMVAVDAGVLPHVVCTPSSFGSDS